VSDPVAEYDKRTLADQHGTHAHPRPSGPQALEHSKMRDAASDATQRNVWVAFFVGLALFLAGALYLAIGSSP
jgi:hypothetical protein